MKDGAKKQLDIINSRIEKAKTSLENIKEVDEIKTLSVEVADIIPLGEVQEKSPKKDK